MELQNFIQQRPFFVWWTKEHASLSDASIVEATLKYGDWDDVQEMIRLVGMKKVADIFRRQASGIRSNYSPKTKHFFTLYFNTYASGNS